MPQRSQPDSAKTPGCSALYIASSRCALRIRAVVGLVDRGRSVMPSAAATTVAVVQAMPFVVKTRL